MMNVACVVLLVIVMVRVDAISQKQDRDHEQYDQGNRDQGNRDQGNRDQGNRGEEQRYDQGNRGGYDRDRDRNHGEESREVYYQDSPRRGYLPPSGPPIIAIGPLSPDNPDNPDNHHHRIPPLHGHDTYNPFSNGIGGSDGFVTGGGGYGGGLGHDFPADGGYGVGHDTYPGPGGHHQQGPGHNYLGHNKIKSFLLPLAGFALLGAAAALITNPLLLKLGVVAGKRKRRDLNDGSAVAYRGWTEIIRNKSNKTNK